MKRYALIWVLLFAAFWYLLSPGFFLYDFLYELSRLHYEDVVVRLGLVLLLCTQVTGFLRLSRQIKDLKEKDQPKDVTASPPVEE